MERLGFGPRTINLDYDQAGTLVIHLVKGRGPYAAYGMDSGSKIRAECLPALREAGIDSDRETLGYGDELRGEGKGSFLTLAHGLRLASHPNAGGSSQYAFSYRVAEDGAVNLSAMQQRELWRSKTMKAGPTATYDLDLSTVQELELLVEDGGDGTGSAGASGSNRSWGAEQPAAPLPAHQVRRHEEVGK